eukprot:1196348-Prorocentrum_minimum.AAC.3
MDHRMDSIIRALKFMGTTVIASPFVIWIGSFMHAFVFADEICKSSFLGVSNSPPPPSQPPPAPLLVRVVMVYGVAVDVTGGWGGF